MKKKGKILFFGWEQFEWDILKSKIEEFAKDFEIVFAQYDTHALDEIAKAKLIHNNPITGIVFKRNVLIANDHCRLIAQFAEHYSSTKYPTCINLIDNDQDIEARNASVVGDYAKEGDWNRIFTIFNN